MYAYMHVVSSTPLHDCLLVKAYACMHACMHAMSLTPSRAIIFGGNMREYAGICYGCKIHTHTHTHTALASFYGCLSRSRVRCIQRCPTSTHTYTHSTGFILWVFIKFPNCHAYKDVHTHTLIALSPFYGYLSSSQIVMHTKMSTHTHTHTQHLLLPVGIYQVPEWSPAQRRRSDDHGYST